MRHTFSHIFIAPFTLGLLLSGCSGEPGSGNTPEEDMSASQQDMRSPAQDMSPGTDQSTPTSPDMTPASPQVASGKSDCGTLPTGENVSCQPSQYCADSILNRCELGCLSDANCPGNESCAKQPGQNAGFCQRKPGEQGNLPADPSRTGQSTCGVGFDGSPVSCQPSQYCSDSTLTQCQAGCVSDFNCPDGEQCDKTQGQHVGSCAQLPPPDPCESVSCDAGEVCVNGVCNAIDPCAGVSCGNGEVCVEGSCTRTDPCTGVMCQNNQTCVDGMCQNSDPCAGVSCGNGEVCERGSCVPSRTSCIPNATAQDGCPSDQLCIFDENDDTLCFKFPACDAQNQCDVGLFGAVCSTEFINGKDPQCLPETCVDDSHCPNTWHCVVDPGFPAGFCDEGEFGSFCTDDQDCNAGLSCDSFSGTCV